MVIPLSASVDLSHDSKIIKDYVFDPLQIGNGLLILQQMSGINGVLFYSSTIFKEAGKPGLYLLHLY